MSIAGEPLVVTKQAAADLSALTYRLVQLNGSGLVVAASSGSSPAVSGVIGVLYNAPRSGEAASVALDGYARVFVQNSVADGAFVTAGTSAGVITAASGDLVIGRVMARANPSDIGEIRLGPAWRLVGAVN